MKNGEVFAQGDLKDIFSTEILTGFFGKNTTVSWNRQQLTLKIMDGCAFDNNLLGIQ